MYCFILSQIKNFGISINRQKVTNSLSKKLLPKASKNQQNGDKSPHLVTLVNMYTKKLYFCEHVRCEMLKLNRNFFAGFER